MFWLPRVMVAGHHLIAGHLLGLPRGDWLALGFAYGRAARIHLEGDTATIVWRNR